DLGVMPELGCNYRCGDLLVQGRVQNMTRAPLAPELAINVQSPSGSTSAFSYTTRSIKPGASLYVNFRMPVRGTPDLWAPGHPALYKVTVSTEAQGHREQQDSLRIGMRTLR